MAGPQSFTPRSVKPSRPKRHFTVDQANRSLPLVKRIVGDIVATHAKVVELQAALEQSAAATKQPDQQQQIDSAIRHLDDYMHELSDIGCELKDYQAGLIDFTGRHQGRDVCLCWRLGEEKVENWHEIDGGFAGRQPVSTLQESA